MKKILSDHEPDNVIVELIFYGPERGTYKTVGVLMSEEGDSINVAFNAVNDVVIDYLDIPKKDIIKIRRVPADEIKEYT